MSVVGFVEAWGRAVVGLSVSGEQEQEPRWMRKALKAEAFVNLSSACPGQILFSAAKPNYMFKPTAELALRLIQPCRRGGLTWR